MEELEHLKTKRDYLNILVDACSCKDPILNEIEKTILLNFFINEEEYEYCSKIQRLP